MTCHACSSRRILTSTMTNPPRRTEDGSARPPPECLVRSANPRHKGSTLIAENVDSPAAHARHVAAYDDYRPAQCRHCGHSKLHVHDYRSRSLRKYRDVPTIRIVRYRCANCHATFRVLPAFVPRNLWHDFTIIEQETLATTPSPSRPAIPARTVYRWKARLAARVGPIHDALVEANHPLAATIGLDEPRRDLIATHAEIEQMDGATNLIRVASLVHRLNPKLRLV